MTLTLLRCVLESGLNTFPLTENVCFIKQPVRFLLDLANAHVGERAALKISPFSGSICQTSRLVTLNITRSKAPDVFARSRTNNLSASWGF